MVNAWLRFIRDTTYINLMHEKVMGERGLLVYLLCYRRGAIISISNLRRTSERTNESRMKCLEGVVRGRRGSRNKKKKKKRRRRSREGNGNSGNANSREGTATAKESAESIVLARSLDRARILFIERLKMYEPRVIPSLDPFIGFWSAWVTRTESWKK